MADRKFYVDINAQGQKLVNAELSNVGLQYVADAAALATLAGTLTGETKKIVVYQVDTKVIHVWNGTSFDATSTPISGVFKIRGGLDGSGPIAISAATVTDGTLTYADIQNGNLFIVTVAGTLPANMGSHILEVGDWIVFSGTTAGTFATNGELTTASNWTVIQNNVSAATTTTLGLARQATQSQVDTGVSGSPTPAFVNPETLKATLAARKVVSAALSLPANTPTDVTHNFTTLGFITDLNQVTVEVVLSSTKEKVEVSVIKAANKITLESNPPITVDVAVSAL